MNVIDVIFGIVILFFTFKGVTRGFIKEAISIISFVSALYYNGLYNGYICKIISGFVKIESVFILKFISFVVFYLLIFLLLKLLASFLKKLLGGIGILDNILGGISLFVLSIVLLGLLSMGIDKIIGITSAEDYRITSKLYYPIQRLVKDNIFYFN